MSSEKRQAVRILIIENEEPVARICMKVLQHERLEVRWAVSPEEAEPIIEDWRPQLYFVGDDFPQFLGLELCGQLRGRTNAPIIMLTASDSIGYQVNCLEAGADDVLVRPIPPPLWLAKAQTHLRRAYRYSVPPRSASVPGTHPTNAQRAAQGGKAPRATAPPAPPPSASDAQLPTKVSAAPTLEEAGAALAAAAAAIVISPAPVTPEALAPNTNFHAWPRCETCGYIGPNSRFEGRDESGRIVRGCPSCGENKRIRYPLA